MLTSGDDPTPLSMGSGGGKVVIGGCDKGADTSSGSMGCALNGSAVSMMCVRDVYVVMLTKEREEGKWGKAETLPLLIFKHDSRSSWI